MAEGALVDRAAEVDSVRRTLSAMYRYRELLKNLVAKDLKLKYRGSVLGFLWSLLNPLLMIGVYTVAFKYVLHVQTDIFYLLVGILAWTFFVNSVTMSTGAIIDNGGLIKSIFFPRAVLPVATVLFNFAQYVLTAIVFIPVLMLLTGTRPAAAFVAYPLVVALQTLFTIGLALVIATGTAFFRDLRHFLEVALGALFWLTPIIWNFSNVSPTLRPWLRFSPLAPFVIAYHAILNEGRWPDAATWAIIGVYTGAALAVGLRVMLTQEDKFSEQL